MNFTLSCCQDGEQFLSCCNSCSRDQHVPDEPTWASSDIGRQLCSHCCAKGGCTCCTQGLMASNSACVTQVAMTLLKHCGKKLLALDDMEEIVHYLKAEVGTLCTLTSGAGLSPTMCSVRWCLHVQGNNNLQSHVTSTLSSLLQQWCI